MEESIHNQFALVLLYYDQFKRSKLISSDLIKIAKKYGTKPEKLVTDLTKKYGFIFPKVCKASTIMYIYESYTIPDSYLQLMPKQFSNKKTVPYDPIYDIRSTLFDSEKVLTTKRIISPMYTLELFDNLSKCKPMLSNFDGKVFKFGDVVPKEPKEKVKEEKTVPILDRIGVESCADINYIDDLGTESIQMSPFALAHSLMKTRTRVRVVIRKRASVRGILVGYLRAFDKHFNLLLTDVDEEYVPAIPKEKSDKGQGKADKWEASNRMRKRLKVEKGKGSGIESQKTSEIKVLRRFLPQLLIRGDTVILLSKFSRTNSSFSKMRVQLNAAHATFVASSAPNRSERRSMMNQEKNKPREYPHFRDEVRNDRNTKFRDSKDEWGGDSTRNSNDDVNNGGGDGRIRYEDIRDSDNTMDNNSNRLSHDDGRNMDYESDSKSSRIRYDNSRYSDNFMDNFGSDVMRYDDDKERYNDRNYPTENMVGYDGIRYSNRDGNDNMIRYDDIRNSVSNKDDTSSNMARYQERGTNESNADIRYQEHGDDDRNGDVRSSSSDTVDQGLGPSSSRGESFSDQIIRYRESSAYDREDSVPSDCPDEVHQGSSSDHEYFRDQNVSVPEIVLIPQETLSDIAGNWYAKFAKKDESKKEKDLVVSISNHDILKDKDRNMIKSSIDLDRGSNNERVEVKKGIEGLEERGYDKKRPSAGEDIADTQDSDLRETDDLRGEVLYEEKTNRNYSRDFSGRNIREIDYDYNKRQMESYYGDDYDAGDSRVRGVQSSWDDSRERSRGRGSSRYSSNDPGDSYRDINKEYERDRSYRGAVPNRSDGREREYSYARQSSPDNVRRGTSESYNRYEAVRQRDRGKEESEEHRGDEEEERKDRERK